MPRAGLGDLPATEPHLVHGVELLKRESAVLLNRKSYSVHVIGLS